MTNEVLKVTVKTLPSADQDLTEELTVFLQEKFEVMMEVYKISAMKVCQNMQVKTARDYLATMLTEEFKVPMEILAIELQPRYTTIDSEILIGIKLEEHAIQTWRNMRNQELGDLLDSVFAQ